MIPLATAEPAGMLVHGDDVPWTPAAQGDIKRLHASPETGWRSMLLRGYPGQVNAPHTHEGAAWFYVLEGGASFRGGEARAGDWVWEPVGAVHEATWHAEDTLYIGGMLGPIGLHDDKGRPPGYGDPVGAALVRTSELPWIDDGRGAQIRVLRIGPETGYMHLMVRVNAGSLLPARTYLGPAEMYVLEGEMPWREGCAGPGDLVWEPAGAHQEAVRFTADTIFLANLYGPVLYAEAADGAGELVDARALQRLVSSADA
ncbi:cupin domain-containing protein [Phenylobacterium sp.]|uniref:cupin domain-containing protein n=1 Tax=Phenylobacterium sp. TaxID=1871053 RepID=UPI002F3E3382